MNCTQSRDAPFSYDYWQFGQYSNCDDKIGGNYIYYNRTDSLLANCDCVAGFRADPDIAGPGVMTSFIATAFITLCVTLVDLFCGMCLSCRDQLNQMTSGTQKDDIRILLIRFDRSKSPKWLGIKHRYPLEKLELAMSKLPPPLSWVLWIFAYLVILLFRNDHPKTHRFAKLALDLLCDIQVLTGLAIIISGFVQLQEMTFYHQQFVMNYWFLALNSFWAARSGALDQKDEDLEVDRWHYWTRKIAIFCCLVLSATYQILVIPAQKKYWDPVRDGKCYIIHDKSIYEVQYLWLAGTIVYAAFLGFAICVGLIWRDLKFVNGLPNATDNGNEAFRVKVKEFRNTWITNSPPFTKILIYISFALVLIVHYLLTIIFDILAWGNPKSILVVGFYFGAAAWNMYNIIDMKLSNQELVGIEERGWGFGQCLAVGLLGLVLLNCGDAWRESRKATSATRPSPLQNS